MNNLSAPSRTPKTSFDIEAEKAADFLKRRVESAKQFHEHYLKAAFKMDADVGVLVRGVTKKGTNLTAAFFNTLRLATIIAGNSLGFDGAFQKQMLKVLKNLHGSTARPSTGLNASVSFNTVRISNELAEHATNHVAKHVERASLLSENFIRNVEAEYKVPWSEQYTKLAAEYNSCLLYTSPSPRDQRGSRMPSSA